MSIIKMQYRMNLSALKTKPDTLIKYIFHYDVYLVYELKGSVLRC